MYVTQHFSTRFTGHEIWRNDQNFVLCVFKIRRYILAHIQFFFIPAGRYFARLVVEYFYLSPVVVNQLVFDSEGEAGVF